MRADRVGGIISLIFGAVSLAEAVRLYPAKISMFVGDHTLPGVIGVSLIILGIVMAVGKGTKFEVVFPERNTIVKMLLVFGLLFAYWFSLQYLGYNISTFIASACLFRMMGSYNYTKCTVYSACLTAALYLIFIYWLEMPFPTGIFDI
ncbi:tripartite tricarboxylate transporter TctB family protein [Paenibacillus hamazuiensis]|uniref:tripartite tricarboxylate transporter TctB family protein n=1 Tax=Paenibacillus hamazuiensis TaxID=2936508 RepID=UPI00200D7949|nr:tripartite tricarboxylate transporter TctB family protein [Paenibacillus hamazuiensis]